MVSQTTVALAVAGDDEAFQTIVAHYEPHLYRFLYGLVGNHELAQDLTQDTLLSAYQGISRTGADLNLTAWLFRIAKNHAVSELRRRRLVSWLPLLRRKDDGEEEEAPGIGQTADAGEEALGRLAVREALTQLDVEGRSLLLLAAEGFSYVEIGEMTGLSTGAVRQRIFRARERLRALQRQEG